MSSNAKILYVDDEPINLQLFEINFLGKFDILTAENGYDGLDTLKSNPDIMVVISDMKMPKMDGLNFIRKAKAIYQDKKFCILTGFEISSDIQQALDSGLILKYFSKPFNIQEIDTALSSALNPA